MIPNHKCKPMHEDSDVYLCRCDCGREENICGDCLREGRITMCSECQKKAN